MGSNRNSVITRIQKAYQECLRFSSEHPDIAVNRCRKILEMILIQNHREKQGEPDPKAMYSVDLLVNVGRQLGIITPLQGLNMRVIQTFGNFGSHFQDGAEDELCFEELKIRLTFMKNACSHHVRRHHSPLVSLLLLL